jgi:hypothetical protein
LEAERAQLLVQMIEARQQPVLSAPYAVTSQTAAAMPPEPAAKALAAVARILKPDGLPSMSAMVMSVLDTAELALEPRQIRDRIRQKYWPDVPIDRVASAVWRLAKGGKLHYRDRRYWCNGHCRQ